MMSELKCPLIISKGNAEESMDYCTETERPSGRIKVCLLVSGQRCDTWQAIQREWDSEKFIPEDRLHPKEWADYYKAWVAYRKTMAAYDKAIEGDYTRDTYWDTYVKAREAFYKARATYEKAGKAHYKVI